MQKFVQNGFYLADKKHRIVSSCFERAKEAFKERRCFEDKENLDVVHVYFNAQTKVNRNGEAISEPFVPDSEQKRRGHILAAYFRAPEEKNGYLTSVGPKTAKALFGIAKRIVEFGD